MLLHLNLLAVVVTGAVFFERAGGCLRNAPSIDQWDRERPSVSDLRVGGDRGDINTPTMVLSDYRFYCSGTISQWRLQWHPRSRLFWYRGCSVTFTFYALRPEAGNDCILTLMGNNTVTIEPRIRYGESIFNISVEDRITVKAGDIVGLRVQFDSFCGYMRLWIGGTHSTNNTVYHKTFEEEENEPSQLNTQIDDINICTSYNDRDEESPHITAVVEPVSETTPTNIHPKETSIQPSGSVRMTRRVNFGGGRPAMAGTDGSGGNMVILTSVGASVGVLLVIAAVLTAVLCLWQCSKRKISKSVPENSPQFDIGENEAYGAHTQHPPQEQVRNGGVSGVVAEKLPQKTRFLMEENEAYTAHTHQPQGTDLNGYYDTVEYKEEEGNDYVVAMGEPVYYEVPS